MFFANSYITGKKPETWEIELAKKQLEIIHKIKSEQFRDTNKKD